MPTVIDSIKREFTELKSTYEKKSNRILSFFSGNKEFNLLVALESALKLDNLMSQTQLALAIKTIENIAIFNDKTSIKTLLQLHSPGVSDETNITLATPISSKSPLMNNLKSIHEKLYRCYERNVLRKNDSNPASVIEYDEQLINQSDEFRGLERTTQTFDSKCDVVDDMVRETLLVNRNFMADYQFQHPHRQVEFDKELRLSKESLESDDNYESNGVLLNFDEKLSESLQESTDDDDSNVTQQELDDFVELDQKLLISEFERLSDRGIILSRRLNEIDAKLEKELEPTIIMKLQQFRAELTNELTDVINSKKQYTIELINSPINQQVLKIIEDFTDSKLGIKGSKAEVFSSYGGQYLSSIFFNEFVNNIQLNTELSEELMLGKNSNKIELKYGRNIGVFNWKKEGDLFSVEVTLKLFSIDYSLFNPDNMPFEDGTFVLSADGEHLQKITGDNIEPVLKTINIEKSTESLVRKTSDRKDEIKPKNITPIAVINGEVGLISDPESSHHRFAVKSMKITLNSSDLKAVNMPADSIEENYIAKKNDVIMCLILN